MRIRALDKISFSITRGEIISIRGTNGSGKSTLLRIIAGLSKPTTGIIEYKFNRNVKKPSPRIGYCPDNPIIYRNVSVSEFLIYILKILGLEKKHSPLIKLITDFNLIKWIDEPIGSLSRGMLHKVALIMSMIDSPQLLILDEPFSSLDENSADVLIENLQLLSHGGSGIILADPRSDRLEEIADKSIDLGTYKVIS